MRIVRSCLTAVALSSILPAAASAQIRASEIGTVSQVIDGTKITLEYSRPRMRARTVIFGTPAVQWGERWTPGANWATTFETSRDITLGGVPVKAGKYSMWFDVRQSGDWTLLLDPRVHRFHMDRPDSIAGQIRIPARVVESTPVMDVLTWWFPELRMEGGTLAMQWATTRVNLDVAVKPSMPSTLEASQAQPYLGRYAWTELDSTGKVVKSATLIVSYEDNTLKGQWEPNDPYFRKFALVRYAPDWFAPAIYDQKGELYEVMRPDLTFAFKVANGRATSIEWRDESDALIGRGTRLP